MRLKPGDTVFHVWGNPFNGKSLSLKMTQLLGISMPGVVIGLEDERPFIDSPIPYWNVLVAGDVKQWREDMILLAS